MAAAGSIGAELGEEGALEGLDGGELGGLDGAELGEEGALEGLEGGELGADDGELGGPDDEGSDEDGSSESGAAARSISSEIMIDPFLLGTHHPYQRGRLGRKAGG